MMAARERFADGLEYLRFHIDGRGLCCRWKWVAANGIHAHHLEDLLLLETQMVDLRLEHAAKTSRHSHIDRIQGDVESQDTSVPRKHAAIVKMFQERRHKQWIACGMAKQESG